MKQLASYFFRGSLVLIPVAATLYIVYFIVAAIDRLLPIGVPGLGFVITVSFVTLTGFLASNVVGKTALGIAERFFTRVPLVKLLYSSIKDLIGAFVGEQRRFDRPVSVALSADGHVKAIGFVTRSDLGPLGLPNDVAVYFPQSYNFAGNLVLVPKDRITLLDVSSSDVMTFIVSGGVSGLGVGPALTPS